MSNEPHPVFDTPRVKDEAQVSSPELVGVFSYSEHCESSSDSDDDTRDDVVKNVVKESPDDEQDFENISSLLAAPVDAVLKPDTHNCFRTSDPRKRGFWTQRDPQALKSSQPSPRLMLANLRYRSRLGRVWSGLMVITNMCSTTLFVCIEYAQTPVLVVGPFDVQVETNTDGKFNYNTIKTMMLVLNHIYMLDYFVRVLAAKSRTRFVLKSHELLDLFIIVTVQVSFWDVDESGPSAKYDLGLATSLRMLFVMNGIKGIRKSHIERRDSQPTGRSRIHNQIMDIAMHAFAIVSVGAAFFMHIENWSDNRDPKLGYFHCVYFVVTSMTTVGYGDISPSSNYSMGFTIVLMLFLIIVLFPMITKAADLAAAVTPSNSFPATYTDQPVILFQAGNEISVERVKAIVEELYHEDQPQKVTLCVVSAFAPNADMRCYLEEMKNVDPVAYIEGTLMDDDTCRRAGVEYAKAIILLPPEKGLDVNQLNIIDEQLCLSATRVRLYTDDMAMRKKLSQHPAKIVLVLNSIYHEFYFRDSFYGAIEDKVSHSRVFSLSELQMAALGKSVLCPAFMAMTSNIAGRGDDLPVIEGIKMADWVHEYLVGMQVDAYNILLPKELAVLNSRYNVSSYDLSALVYAATGNILLLPMGGGKHQKILARQLNDIDPIVQFMNQLDFDQIKNSKVWDYALPHPVYTPPCHDAASIPQPLSDAAMARVQDAYAVLGLLEGNGSLSDFSKRHFVRDPALREVPNVPVDDLVHTPDSKVAHRALEGNNIDNVSGRPLRPSTSNQPLSFRCILTAVAQVLRQSDVPELRDIVIVTSDIGSEDTHTLLKMFERVYIVKCPDKDLGCVSRQTLLTLQVRTAHAVVLTANKSKPNGLGPDFDKNHLMCLRMLVRKENPRAIVILEIDDYKNVRYVIKGNKKIHAWADKRTIRSSQQAYMTKFWTRRSDAMNRAACVASGSIVEEDLYLKVSTSAVHTATSSTKIIRSLIGDNEHDIALHCPNIDPFFVGKTFIELFVTAAKNKQNVIALYRDTGPEVHGGQKYIYTCPLPDTILRASDRIYVAYKKNTLSNEAASWEPKGLLEPALVAHRKAC